MEVDMCQRTRKRTALLPSFGPERRPKPSQSTNYVMLYLSVSTKTGQTVNGLQVMTISNHYEWLPIVASLTWCITLLTLLITWAAQGRPHYVSQNGPIPFISDIGADVLRPFFITGCSITAIFFVLTLFAERWLRHNGRLLHHTKRSQKVLASLAIAGAFMAGCGLVLLSIFDTKRHESLHRLFLGIFMLGVILSALFTVAEFALLNKLHGAARRSVMISYTIKATLVGILVCVAVAFAVCLGVGRMEAAGYLEWIIAFGFIFYPISFCIELMRSKPRGESYDAREPSIRSNGELGSTGAIPSTQKPG